MNLSDKNKYLLRLIQNNKALYESLSRCLDISILKAIKSTIEKYNLTVPIDERIRAVDFFDKRKKKIEYALKLSEQYK